VNSKDASPVAELCLAVMSVIGAIALWVGSEGLPPPRWEPLGSAAVPRALAVLLVVFSVWIGVTAAIRLYRAHDRTLSVSSAPIIRGGLLFAALVAFVSAIDVFAVPFVPAATLFVIASVSIIAGPSFRNIIFAAIGGGLLSGLLFTIFTRFFFVNLG
jgi:putative tricarboxylic transport membrane protein